MSKTDVERLRAVYEEWARGNFAAGGELLADDVSFTGAVAEGDVTVHGIAAVDGYMRDFLSQWERYVIAADDFVDLGDTVLMVGRQQGKGRTSGVSIDERMFGVWRFRDGRAVEVRHTYDEQAARQAAGIGAD